MQPHVLGLDIGGANLKAAHTDRTTRFRPFPVWKHPERLADELRALMGEFAPFDLVAVTMTAELCDCYANKEEGVNAILDATVAAAEGKRIVVWQATGRFVDVEQARKTWRQTAAANWLALATYTAEYYAGDENAVVIDIGSTTTDIVPIRNGMPSPQGLTDTDRLANKELIYMGVRRTPIAAILDEIEWRGNRIRPAAECFATTGDAYLLLGYLPEDATDCNTADGRPFTKAAAHHRLARMICMDGNDLSASEICSFALQVKEKQLGLLMASLIAIAGEEEATPRPIFTAGEGRFLANEMLSRSPRWREISAVTIIETADDPESQTVCAYAVARLAVENVIMAEAQPPIVVKLGGSLFDLPHLGRRLQGWLATLPHRRIILVAGGGQSVDWLRRLDQENRLAPKSVHRAAHWAMQVNAHILQLIIPDSVIAAGTYAVTSIHLKDKTPIVWWTSEGSNDDRLPQTWATTSDSIAAMVAVDYRASELILLKSVTPPEGKTWKELADAGIVDEWFPNLADKIPSIHIVNFREWAAEH